MASSQGSKDLQWVLESMRHGSLDLCSVSFFLSQAGSYCYLETENSIIVNISKDDVFSFSELLKVLGMAKKSVLKHIEFHLVEWKMEQAKDLLLLLENNTNVKQLVFKRNKFDAECFKEIAGCLRRNKCVKEIMLSESGIGSAGASALASVLLDNDILEELQIWEDSIGWEGAEELSKMIEVNSTLKLLTIFDSKSITATPLVSAVLARNRSTEVHIWSVDHKKKSSKVVEFVPESSTLRIYQIDIKGACRVACALGLNSTVRSLDMTGVRLKSRWAKEFRWVLEQNRTLKEVKLSKTYLKDKGVIYVAAGLFKNQSLENLHLDGNWFGGIAVEHLLCPLSKYSALQNQANTTLKTITLGGGKTKIGKEGLAAIIQMLTSNQSITCLGIYDDESLKPHDIVRIFKSLEKNATLKYLSLQGCKGVKGELVLQQIMDTLNVNPWIEDINLKRTPLQIAGKTEDISKRFGQAERTEPDVDMLKNMPMTVPKSCRIFLCGQEYAGKSTLCNSLSRNFSPMKVSYLDQVRTIVDPVEQAVSTPGIRINTFKDEDTKISIWNFAGQHEKYSLHDVMFPGHGCASLFLIISSLFRKPSKRELKLPSEVEEELQYWLRYIVSNSKRAIQQCMMPNVTVVLTHFDKINQQSDDFLAIASSIKRLRDKFQGFVEFYPTVFTLDARSSASVDKLSHHVRKTSKTILERVPRVYQLCDDLMDIIADWRLENGNKPTMKWKEFQDICQINIPSLRIHSRHGNKEKFEARRRAVATCLHQIGELIYFEGVEFLILDYEWFYGEVLGELTRVTFKRENSSEKSGFILKKDLEKVLIKNLQSHIPGMRTKVFENLEANSLVSMMLKLEICYEQDPSDPNSPIFFPSNLEEGRWKHQRWLMDTPDSNYVGRHLQCDDSSHMFLTADFFPRLQVHLHNKIMGLKNQHGASYSLEKRLISITINGIHIRIELGEQYGYYVDVLACSTKSPTEMLRLLQQLIIPAIQSLCHGITLSEYVLRSECVKNLTPHRYRRNQLVHLQLLKQALLSLPADAIYDYQHTWDSSTDSAGLLLGPGFDFARVLLSDDDFQEVIHCRYHDLHNLATELQVTQENDPNHAISQETTSSVEPTFAGIAKGVEAVLQRLKIIEQEIRDIKQEIQGLRYHEHRILIELHRKVNYLVNYNTQLEERKVPNMFYFVRTENYSRRLITSVISGMTALRLHMLCEYRREMHVVEDQIGCELMQVDNITMRSLAPYMKKFMKLLTFALKIGAHLAAGMGQMIPDLGREVIHLIDSPALYGAAGAAAAGAAGAAIVANRSRNRSSNDTQQDIIAAQQWLMDFLRDQGCSTAKDIADKFGLWRIRYKDEGQIAWICRRHMCTRTNEIIQVPI
ncbi:protein TORNADO 1 [Dorcoceras hygrometricum]|uniref:Protein TORNADO 1 n=1 Tax=Dorcoceras hygrometricum TaxID=472368 RepID=A0A2Z7A6H6_9LAMI|nr:protein TORNADO 1 [Dorcoceras hygrometricum]